jgi:hypothetical protein
MGRTSFDQINSSQIEFFRINKRGTIHGSCPRQPAHSGPCARTPSPSPHRRAPSASAMPGMVSTAGPLLRVALSRTGPPFLYSTWHHHAPPQLLLCRAPPTVATKDYRTLTSLPIWSKTEPPRAAHRPPWPRVHAQVLDLIGIALTSPNFHFSSPSLPSPGELHPRPFPSLKVTEPHPPPSSSVVQDTQGKSPATTRLLCRRMSSLWPSFVTSSRTHLHGELLPPRPYPMTASHDDGAQDENLATRIPPARSSHLRHRTGRGHGDHTPCTTSAASQADGPGWAGHQPARSWAMGQMPAQQSSNSFLYPFLFIHSRNSYKLTKFIENRINLRKIQHKFP